MSAQPEQIVEALKKLDVSNDNHWTEDGLPRVETVRMLVGDQSLDRKTITAAAPQFTRAAVIAAAQAPTQQAQNTDPTATPVPTSETQQGAPQAQSQDQVTTQTASEETSEDEDVDQPVQAAEPSLEDRQTELLHLQEEIAQLDGQLVKLSKQKADLNVKADALILEIDKLTPKSDNQRDIIEYLEQQKRQLQLRKQKIDSLKGVNLADLLPSRSPIDTAMARKSGHGKGRPNL